MISIFKDFYAMAYQFARKLDPKRGYDGAAEYARHMCTLWMMFSIALGVELAMLPSGIPFRDLLGRTRLVGDVVVIVALILCSMSMNIIIRRTKDLQSYEDITSRYNRLPRNRLLGLLALVVCTPIVLVLLSIWE